MGKRTLHVELVAYTPQPEEVIAFAGRRCYASADNETLRQRTSPESAAGFIHRLTQRKMGDYRLPLPGIVCRNSKPPV
ncbi:MAG TPA: hypothetical protein EYP63_09470 [Desulfotomaculum sp.]|nr:hypothetical protein [Desulfotomaculum sp.]